MSTFKVDDIVLYQNGERFELGVVKEVLDKNKYRVWYHMGDTTAVTDGCNLHKIDNAYAFNIIRKSVNKDDINLCPARKIASRILGQFELYGDFYYKLEDWLTSCLEGWYQDVPVGINGEYLRCALRIEIRDYFDHYGIIDVEPFDIEECVDRIVNHINHNVLDTQFIEDIVYEYSIEKFPEQMKESDGTLFDDDKDGGD